MALTRDQWFEKLKSWVPPWFFTTSAYQEAEFKSLAKLLSVTQESAENVIKQTFISEASGGFLDLHGSERTVTRNEGESDEAYATRIRVATNSVILASLRQTADSMLNNGAVILLENCEHGFFGDDIFFGEDGVRLLDGTKFINWMTFIIPAQSGDVEAVKTAFVRAIEDAKGLGMTYDVLLETA